LIAALMAVILIAAFGTFGTDLKNSFTSIGAKLQVQ
jgi:Flp pilus assembly pilin Flp